MFEVLHAEKNVPHPTWKVAAKWGLGCGMHAPPRNFMIELALNFNRGVKVTIKQGSLMFGRFPCDSQPAPHFKHREVGSRMAGT